MDTNELSVLAEKIDTQQKTIDAMFISVEKLRGYFKWTLIISIVVIVLPMIGLMVAIPAFIKTLQIPVGLGL